MDTSSIKPYLETLPDEDRDILVRLIATVGSGLKEGFELEMNYGLPGWVVPLSRYPKGYHTAKGIALPFVSFARQKHYYALYVMFPELDPKRFTAFREAYASRYGKLDMGVGCLRLRKPDKIPYDLIADWFRDVEAQTVINHYEHFLASRVKGD